MAENGKPVDFAAPDETPIDLFSRDNAWYKKDIGDRIPDSGRKLLEEYSKIKPEDVDRHIYEMRDALWDHAPYPCIGEFKFLDCNLPHQPSYPRILELLTKVPAEGQPAPVLLDLGCCVAQELRALAHAGVPTERLYGSDVNAHFLDVSYSLFKDKDTFKGTLIPGDIKSETLFEDSFKGWEGKFDVVFAGLFLHLFSKEQQIPILGRIMRLLKKEPGVVFVGEAAGCLGGGERSHQLNKEKLQSRFGKQFLHDDVTFKAIWDEVAKKEGMEGVWKVEAKFTPVTQKKLEKIGHTFFQGEGIGRVMWSCERI